MEETKLNLTIYLLKPDKVAAFEKELIEGKANYPLLPPFDGYFRPLTSAVGEPRWATVIRSSVQNPVDFTLNAQSPAGILVVRRDGKTFVITFGHAWQKLEDEWLERDFGRRVALNSIPHDKLVEIRTEQVFAKWHLANERAPRASSITEFGVEFDRDLLAALEGTPSDEMLGNTLRGATSLRVNLPFSKIGEVLDKATALFGSAAYKKSWPEIDNISPLKDQSLIARLEEQLDSEFISGQAQKSIVMFTPAHKRDEIPPADSYVFGRLTKSPVMRPYLTVDAWTNFLKEKGSLPSVAEAKRSSIHLLDDMKTDTKVWTAFDCFGYEIGLDGRQYLLSSGIWYEVNASFLAKINHEVGTIPQPKLLLPGWNQVESEGEYNLRCAKENKELLNFDAKNLWFGGGKSQFEFCDIMHAKSKTLYFAKIASKSSGMSHLVEQVRRTAELLFNIDDGYRKELVKGFAKHHSKADTSWLKSRPRHGDWQLCFVSLGRTANQFPFFAKCALVRVHNDLRERGHDVSFLPV